MSNLSQAQRDELAARNAAHEPQYWMVLTAADAHELAAGRVPDLVREMARWLAEPVEVMLARTAKARKAR